MVVAWGGDTIIPFAWYFMLIVHFCVSVYAGRSFSLDIRTFGSQKVSQLPHPQANIFDHRNIANQVHPNYGTPFVISYDVVAVGVKHSTSPFWSDTISLY